MNNTSDEPVDRPTAAPFLGALAIIVVVVIGIWLFNLRDGDANNDVQQVGRAVVGQNDALQRQNYHDFQTYTCRAQQANEAEILSWQRDSVAKHGERYVDGVGNVAINGDHATANVTFHFGNAPETTSGAEISFVREDGAWKVCSQGPN